MACVHCRPSRAISVKGDGWTNWLSDCRDVLPGIPDGSISLVLSDPPYGSGGNSMAARLQPSSAKYQSSDALKKYPEIDGDSMLPEAWAALMNQVLRELFRVTAPGGSLLLFCDWRSMNGLLTAAGAARWFLRSVVPWDKGRRSRPMPNGFRNQSELILWAVKPGKLSRPQTVYLDGVFSIPNSGPRYHMTPKPVALLKELLRLAPPGSHVLDPFAGSGPVGVACVELGLTYTGCESVREYHAVACERLAATANARTAAAHVATDAVGRSAR